MGSECVASLGLHQKVDITEGNAGRQAPLGVTEADRFSVRGAVLPNASTGFVSGATGIEGTHTVATVCRPRTRPV